MAACHPDSQCREAPFQPTGGFISLSRCRQPQRAPPLKTYTVKCVPILGSRLLLCPSRPCHWRAIYQTRFMSPRLNEPHTLSGHGIGLASLAQGLLPGPAILDPLCTQLPYDSNCRKTVGPHLRWTIKLTTINSTNEKFGHTYSFNVFSLFLLFSTL